MKTNTELNDLEKYKAMTISIFERRDAIIKELDGINSIIKSFGGGASGAKRGPKTKTPEVVQTTA